MIVGDGMQAVVVRGRASLDGGDALAPGGHAAANGSLTATCVEGNDGCLVYVRSNGKLSIAGR